MHHRFSGTSLVVAAPGGPVADVLTFGLGELDGVVVHRLSLHEILAGWRQGEWSAALMPPTEYFRDGLGRILPGIGPTPAPDAHIASLSHLGELGTLQRVAVDSEAELIVSWTALLLRATVNAAPAFVPGDHTDVDGRLSAGLDAMFRDTPYPHRVDLDALWSSHYGPAAPILVWACGPRAPYVPLRQCLARACQVGQASLESIGAMHDAHQKLPIGATSNFLERRLRFTFGSAEADGLRALLSLGQQLETASPAAAVRFC